MDLENRCPGYRKGSQEGRSRNNSAMMNDNLGDG